MGGSRKFYRGGGGGGGPDYFGIFVICFGKFTEGLMDLPLEAIRPKWPNRFSRGSENLYPLVNFKG